MCCYSNKKIMDTVDNSPSQEGLASRMLQTGLFIDKFYTPLLCLFGTLGNSLSLAVFCLDSKYRSQSSSYYLSALAVSDTGFLLNLLAVWLESVHGGVITSNIMCPLVMYLGQVTCFMSVYLTVAFSIERYVAVHYPFSRPRICTRSKAKKGILALTVVALLLFSYVWFIAKVVQIKSPQSSKLSQTGANETGNCQQFPKRNFSTIDNGVEKTFNAMQYEILFHRDKDNKTTGRDIGEPTEYPMILTLTSLTELPRLEGNMVRSAATTTLKIDPFGQISKSVRPNEFSHIGSKRPMKMIQRKTEYEKEEQRNKKWNYFSLIDDGLPQQQENSDKNVGPLFSFGTTGTTDGNDNRTLTVDSRPDLTQNVFTYSNVTQITMSGSHNLKPRERCRNRCTVPKNYHKISEIANYMDTAVTLIIPFLLITYFNVRISLSVWKLKDQRQQIVASPSIPTNKAATLVVTDASPGSHSPITKLTNNHLLHAPSHQNQHISATTVVSSGAEDFDENGPCHWHPKQEKGVSVRVENISSGVCRYTACLEESGAKLTLNADQDRLLVPRAEPIILGNNSSDVVKRDFSMSREVQRATFHQLHHSTSSEIKVTKTLLLVSTVFLAFNLPLHVLRCTQFVQSVTGTQEGKEILQALQPWANLLFNSNFAVNFLLYCASGRNFRTSLKHIASRALSKTQQSSFQQHHRHHDNRRTGQVSAEKRQWRRTSSIPETRNNNSHCHIPLITTTVIAKGTQDTEFLEIRDIVGIGIENGSVNLSDTGNEESITV